MMLQYFRYISTARLDIENEINFFFSRLANIRSSPDIVIVTAATSSFWISESYIYIRTYIQVYEQHLQSFTPSATIHIHIIL